MNNKNLKSVLEGIIAVTLESAALGISVISMLVRTCKMYACDDGYGGTIMAILTIIVIIVSDHFITKRVKTEIIEKYKKGQIKEETKKKEEKDKKENKA